MGLEFQNHKNRAEPFGSHGFYDPAESDYICVFIYYASMLLSSLSCFLAVVFFIIGKLKYKTIMTHLLPNRNQMKHIETLILRIFLITLLLVGFGIVRCM